MRAAATLLSIGLLVLPTDMSSQVSTYLRRGQWVRITAPTLRMHRQVATFVGQRGDTLTVRTDSALVVPLATITQLDISRGRSNTTTIVGAIVGAIGGAGVGIALSPKERHDPLNVNSGFNGPVAGAVVGFFVGGFVGGLVGKSMRGEGWEGVPLDRLRASIVVQRDGRLGIGSAFVF